MAKSILKKESRLSSKPTKVTPRIVKVPTIKVADGIFVSKKAAEMANQMAKELDKMTKA